MKQHITTEDLEQLSESQLQTLNTLWMPDKYDLVVALVCKDVSIDKYDKVEFIVGNIEIFHTSVSLHDLKYINNSSDELNVEEEDTEEDLDVEDAEDDEYEETDEEEELSSDDEFDFSYEQPVSYNKKDCIPLLNIGQMIDILQRNNFGQGDFYLIASSNDSSCELGKNYASMDNYVNEYESKELCDVLWESIKSIL